MNKEFKILHETDANFIENEALPIEARPEKIKHLLFMNHSQDDAVTIPLCGSIEPNIMATRRLKFINCRKCLETLQHLATLDTHQGAVDYVTSIAPTVLQPDPIKVAERVRSKPTEVAKEHMKAQVFLDSKMLKHADDLPTNIVGSKRSTYYFNLVKLDVIYTEGENMGKPNQETMARIQEQIDNLIE